ncbi:hypothetical protein GCM10023224_06550 [Streptomonospora halophila]|uniref:Uncharacterized protein n=1 Tax=Streptomonospora halophila TaxID=427369 RepID=A0ABP9G6J2_9ACTN
MLLARLRRTTAPLAKVSHSPWPGATARSRFAEAGGADGGASDAGGAGAGRAGGGPEGCMRVRRGLGPEGRGTGAEAAEWARSGAADLWTPPVPPNPSSSMGPWEKWESWA